MKLLTTSEVCKFHGLSRSAFWRLARKRSLRPVEFDGAVGMWDRRQVPLLKPCQPGRPGQIEMEKIRQKIASTKHLWE